MQPVRHRGELGVLTQARNGLLQPRLDRPLACLWGSSRRRNNRLKRLVVWNRQRRDLQSA